MRRKKFILIDASKGTLLNQTLGGNMESAIPKCNLTLKRLYLELDRMLSLGADPNTPVLLRAYNHSGESKYQYFAPTGGDIRLCRTDEEEMS